MKMNEINVRRISGKKTVSREDGRIIYEKIKKLWSTSARIKINFANLLIASVSFMDEAFGQLALEYSEDELKSKLEFGNMNQYDRALLNDVISSRIRQRIVDKVRRDREKKGIKIAVRSSKNRH
jgi:seryl-tRNA(Sec) selenium transferase